MSRSRHYDIVIVGGGLAGLAMAAGLADLPLRVALVEAGPVSAECPEPGEGVDSYDPRVSAITLASQQLLSQVGAWEAIVSARICHYTDMQVWDAEGTGEVHFQAGEVNADNLGHIVENRLVLAALAGILLIAELGLSVPQFLLLLALVNIGVAIYIYSLVPEFLLRFLAFLMSMAMYRLTRSGLEHIPERGPALLVCNHVSFADAVLIFGASARPVRFVMEAAIFRNPVLGPLFRAVGAVPIAPRAQEPKVYEAAFQRIQAYLDAGELVCIFPEGMITRTGAMNEFRGGTMRILKANPVPVIPLALRGLWGSLFSRADGASKLSLQRLYRRRIELVAGEVVSASQASPTMLYRKVAALRGNRA